MPHRWDIIFLHRSPLLHWKAHISMKPHTCLVDITFRWNNTFWLIYVYFLAKDFHFIVYDMLSSYQTKITTIYDDTPFMTYDSDLTTSSTYILASFSLTSIFSDEDTCVIKVPILCLVVDIDLGLSMYEDYLSDMSFIDFSP